MAEQEQALAQQVLEAVAAYTELEHQAMAGTEISYSGSVVGYSAGVRAMQLVKAPYFDSTVGQNWEGESWKDQNQLRKEILLTESMYLGIKPQTVDTPEWVSLLQPGQMIDPRKLLELDELGGFNNLKGDEKAPGVEQVVSYLVATDPVKRSEFEKSVLKFLIRYDSDGAPYLSFVDVNKFYLAKYVLIPSLSRHMAKRILATVLRSQKWRGLIQISSPSQDMMKLAYIVLPLAIKLDRRALVEKVLKAAWLDVEDIFAGESSKPKRATDAVGLIAELLIPAAEYLINKPATEEPPESVSLHQLREQHTPGELGDLARGENLIHAHIQVLNGAPEPDQWWDESEMLNSGNIAGLRLFRAEAPKLNMLAMESAVKAGCPVVIDVVKAAAERYPQDKIMTHLNKIAR